MLAFITFNAQFDYVCHRKIAARFNLDEKKALENVLFIRAYTSEHQYEILGMRNEMIYTYLRLYLQLVSYLDQAKLLASSMKKVVSSS